MYLFVGEQQQTNKQLSAWNFTQHDAAAFICSIAMSRHSSMEHWLERLVRYR